MDLKQIEQTHSQNIGKISVTASSPIETMEDLSNVYTPGVAHICSEIHKDPKLASKFTIAGKMVAVISDGSAVLGLGNIGPKASLPVLEGKCAIFKEFAGVEAFPIALDSHETEEIIAHIKAISPTFAAINLEDISAPRCFEIEKRLKDELDIPVMHDDQHGTAIVTLAALKGALKLVPKSKVNIVILGAGAAGNAIAKLLSNAKTILELKISDIKAYDSKGLVSTARKDLDDDKKELAILTNQSVESTLEEGLSDADIFIGVSAANLLTKEMVATMNPDPIIFALANPDPEILPEDAKEGGAKIVATGRSDYPNQVNNALAYPGVFKGLLKTGTKRVEDSHKLKAADAIFRYHVNDLDFENLLPSILDKKLHDIVAESFKG